MLKTQCEVEVALKKIRSDAGILYTVFNETINAAHRLNSTEVPYYDSPKIEAW